MTLGSLFDGSGGFPLAGALCGIVPLWASEIEPYPVAVTRSRFPNMRHLGDVTDIHGDQIEPVDIITFGSPCQDMSVAGKRAGMLHESNGDEQTTRSGLFFEAIRIIDEMRRATNGRYPAFAIWENVTGAFSSNEGEDFRGVLAELQKICRGGVRVPRPSGGKWPTAGEIMADGYSIAWRVLNAQYWGVPQRRRRIYLVADFRGQRAGKILFERAGLRGHPAKGGEARQKSTADTKRGITGSNQNRGRIVSVAPDVFHTLTAANCRNVESAQRPNCVCYAQKEYGEYVPGVGTLTARASVGHTSTTIAVYDLRKESAESDFTRNVATLDCRNLIGNNEISGTLQAKPNGGQSLNFINPVIYDARGNGNGFRAGTLTGDHEGRSTDYTNVICMATAQANAEIESDLSPTILHGNEHPIIVHPSLRRYTVRRLTPLECCRLQGFPDGWGEIDHKEAFTEEEARFWKGIYRRHTAQAGKTRGDIKARALLRWYNGLHTDSAEYKMWGNGIALPCARYVLEGVAEELHALEREGE